MSSRQIDPETNDTAHDRILVIDDDPGILGLMVHLLRRAGYAPHGTTDSREALRILEAFDFDAIVSDVVLPYLSGIELLEQAKQRNVDVPVVLVTAYATEELALDALTKGACGFIEKPFQAAEFLATIRQALWRRDVLRDVLISSSLPGPGRGSVQPSA